MRRVRFVWTVVILLCVVAWAEDPVHFTNPRLKAAVERELSVVDPTPTDMLGLTRLYCTQGWSAEDPITSLTGLEYATNLQVLYLRYNQIGDLSALSGLDNLEELDLSQNQISDLGPLAGLDRLISLNLHGNRISDVSPLAGLESLGVLVLRLNQISDISPLGAVENLWDLDISNNQISDLSPLSALTQLLTLEAFCNQISDLSPLSSVASLGSLYLSGNQISDVSPVAGLENLYSLDLESNRISDISSLCSLTSLSRLDLRSNQLNKEAYETHIPQIIANNPGIRFDYDPHYGRSLRVSSTAGGAVIDPGEGEFIYGYDAYVRLEAVANRGFVFAGWSGDLSSTRNPLFITMDQDYQIQANFLSPLDTLHVDSRASGDPGPDDPTRSDPNEDGTPEHPFDRIQEAIESARKGVTVIVHPGTYRENIDLLYKDLKLIGMDVNDPDKTIWPVIEGAGTGPVVRFNGEGLQGLLTGFVITGGRDPLAGGIHCDGASPTIVHCLIVGNRTTDPNGAAVYCENTDAVFANCTIADNHAGSQGAGITLIDSDVTIINSILWDDAPVEVFATGTSEPAITYNGVRGWWPDYGNIHAEPLFAERGWWADPDDIVNRLTPDDPRAVWVGGDYHLKSAGGRWDPQRGNWVSDLETSPCIDRGHRASPVGQEPTPNGGRINMGIYGGTPEASKSPVETLAP